MPLDLLYYSKPHFEHAPGVGPGDSRTPARLDRGEEVLGLPEPGARPW